MLNKKERNDSKQVKKEYIEERRKIKKKKRNEAGM